MKTVARFALATAWMCMPLVLAQEEAAPAEPAAMREVRIPSHQYVDMTEVDVYRDAAAGKQTHVRFVTTIVAAPVVPPFRTLTVEGRQMPLLDVALVTDKHILCVVPLGRSRDEADVATMHGEIVRGLARGQQVTIQGTVYGPVGARRVVLLERVLRAGEKPAKLEHELLIVIPRAGDAGRFAVSDVGTFEFEVPCSFDPAKTARMLVNVDEHADRERFLLELAKLEAEARKAEEAAEREREPAATEEPGDEPEPVQKRYEPFVTTEVYRMAIQGELKDVIFHDTVAGPVDPDPRIARVRDPRFKDPVRIGYAFDTDTELTCLVRADDIELLERARRLARDERVTIRGTILRSPIARKLVLVDGMDVHAITGVTDRVGVWEVTLAWGDGVQHFFEEGVYTFRFPCMFVADRVEEVRVNLRAVRVVEVPAEEEPEAPAEE